jgi:hypothetical protein
MFDIDLFTLNKDIPVYWKKTKALLHYDKNERALYILHNRDEFDGSKPKDFHKFSTEYRYGWWLRNDTNDNYDSCLTQIAGDLEIRDNNIGRL